MSDEGPPEGLSAAERSRYSRHLLLPDVGEAGQERLKRARVLLIGAGGLGSPASLYLAAAGIGTLGLVDDDVVDVTNLQRQILYGTSAIGEHKLDAARDRLRDLNPHIAIDLFPERFTRQNALELVRAFDVVIDGTDNFATRYLVNDACVLTGRPNVYGSIFRFDGQVSVFCTPTGPCYRCLYPEPPPPGMVPSCAEGGVLGVLPGLVGTMQATEAIKLILGIGTSLAGRLLLIDALSAQWRTVNIRRNPECPLCGTRTQTTLIDYEAFCGLSPSLPDMSVPELTPREVAEKLQRGDDFDLIDVREPHELRIAQYPRAKLIPMGDIANSLDQLDRDRDIVLACRSGARSGRAVQFLLAQGYTRVWNLAGGILRWSDDVDPTVAKY